MMIGRTDEVDGHFVATKFVGLLVPIETVYFAHRGGRATGADSTSEGLRIRIDWRSVALGFGRVWLPVVAIALPLGRFFRGSVDTFTWIASALLIGVSIAAYRGGRLPDEQKAKLRLLGSVTGLRVEPSKLRPNTRGLKRDALADLMDKGGIPMTPDGIMSIVDDIPAPAIPLVYGYARYSGDDPRWQECAALLYERYLHSEV